MIIIVEGIDRVGKTTLCNKLSKELNIPIYKHSQKVMDYSMMDNLNETDKMLQLLDICEITSANIIFDRFHFSDYVYGILERGYYAKIALENLRILDEKLFEMNAVIVYVHPTDIKMSSEQHGKDLIPYFKLMNNIRNMSKTSVYACDYDSIDDMVKKIKELMYEKCSL